MFIAVSVANRKGDFNTHVLANLENYSHLPELELVIKLDKNKLLIKQYFSANFGAGRKYETQKEFWYIYLLLLWILYSSSRQAISLRISNSFLNFENCFILNLPPLY